MGLLEDLIKDRFGADSSSGDASAPEPEEVIAAAFNDVTAKDWALVPEDLTDRLDDYLYGGYLR